MALLAELKSFSLLCEYLIKSSLVLIAAILLVFLLRHKSAALRHFMLSFALICLLLFPLLSTISSGWETSLLPSWTTGTKTAEYVTASNAKIDRISEAHFLSGPTNTADNISSVLTRPHEPLSNSIKLSLFLIWSIGVLFLFSKLLLGLYGAHRLTRQGKNLVSFSWQFLIDKIITTLRIKRKIRLLHHSQIKSPLTWGMIKPVILMPDDARMWTKDQCTSALFHELSHIKRGDFLIKIIARISCAVFWFNPLTWIVLNMMKREQEKACDEFVIKAGVLPSTYAANLLSIRKTGQAHWNPPAAALGALGENQLNERLNAILKKQFKPKEIKMKTKIMLLLTVIMLIVVIGLARPSKSIASSAAAIGVEETAVSVIQTERQEKEVTMQEKEQQKKAQEAEEKKKSEKKKDKYISKDGKTIIFIDEEGNKKKIVLEGDKKVYYVKKDGKDIWTISGDEIKLHSSDAIKAVKLKDGNVFHIKAKDAEHTDHYITLSRPDLKVRFDKTGLKEKNVLHLSSHGKGTVAVHLDSEEHIKLNEKIKAIQKKLQKITADEVTEETAEIDTQTLKEVKEVLAKVAEELELKAEVFKDIHVSVHPKVKLHIEEQEGKVHVHEFEHQEGLEKIHKEDHVIVGFSHEDESIRIKFTTDKIKDLELQKKEILEKLEKELPKGYEVEMLIDEEGSTLSISITGKSENKKDKLKVKELVEKIGKMFKKNK